MTEAGYVVIADDGEGSVSDDGRDVRFDDPLYEEAGEAWEKGPRIGSATGVVTPTGKGKADCRITLSCGGDDRLVIVGNLPLDGTKIGGGSLDVSEGQGRFRNTRGPVTVQVRNPKRFTIP